MKRSLIITTGILTILLVLTIWIYLLLYGAPKNVSNIFTSFDELPEGELQVEIVSVDNNGQVALSGAELEQLTTRAVAGFGLTPTTTSKLRYMERGTGYIYEINLQTGEETQLSLTTLPQVVEAVFSPDAKAVVMTTYAEYQRIVSAAIIVDGVTTLETIALPRGASNIAFADNTKVNYTLSLDGKTIGYVYDLFKETQNQLFTTELTDIVVIWGKNQSSIYLYSKPTQNSPSALYAVSGNQLIPKSTQKLGLSALAYQNKVVISSIVNEGFSSLYVNDQTHIDQAILMLQEKCVFDSRQENRVWCAAPFGKVESDYLENWYNGTRISEDYIWYTDLVTQSFNLTGDLSSLAGRILDVDAIEQHPYADVLIFRNKIDQTLWIYRIPQDPL